LRDHIRDSYRDKGQGFAVIAAAHERDRFALEAADLAIRQNRLKAVTHLDSSAMVVDGVENQHSAVGRLAADSPFLKKIVRVTLDIGPIERMDGYNRNLCVSLFVDLPAQVIHLRD